MNSGKMRTHASNEEKNVSAWVRGAHTRREIDENPGK